MNEKIFKKYASVFGKCCGCCAVVVEKLDTIATQSTTGTSQSKTGSQSTPSKTASSNASVNTGNSARGDNSGVEMQSADSRF